MTFNFTTIPSPVGALTLVASDAGLVAILWENDRPGRVRLGRLEAAPHHPVLIETTRQLRDYFAGERTRFDLPLDFRGTDFQKSVWAALLTIPFGETRSYGEIARQIGCPTASRAVGAANGRNPISIVAPCHRVIGTNGALTGFAGGLAAKELLLGIEARGRTPSA
jgi:methylated-DNA-[protein]-cysteine S-methyltransferase